MERRILRFRLYGQTTKQPPLSAASMTPLVSCDTIASFFSRLRAYTSHRKPNSAPDDDSRGKQRFQKDSFSLTSFARSVLHHIDCFILQARGRTDSSDERNDFVSESFHDTFLFVYIACAAVYVSLFFCYTPPFFFVLSRNIFKIRLSPIPYRVQ